MIRLLHISRLIESLPLATPAGIDRVELAYAQHFLSRAGRDDIRFVVTWPHFTGVLEAAYVKPLIADAASRWAAARTDPSGERSLRQLREIMRDPAATMNAQAPTRIGAANDTRRPLADLLATAAIMLKSHARPLSRMLGELREKGAWYIHVSPFLLTRPHRFQWMSEASVRGLFMLHDLIPIDHPEYFRPGEAARHRVRIDTVLRHADVIVANSDFTRRSLQRHAGEKTPPIDVVPLGVSQNFIDRPEVAAVDASIPYFVVVGTIEPRKNLEFLLTLWRRWTDHGKRQRARLVIVGRRGWDIENVANLLDRSAGLAPTVIEVQALSDAGMIALLRGAAALIAPSWVEGFGLPIAEAMALGVPVLASDIEAHREVGGSFAEYIGPLDGRGWVQALDDYCAKDSGRRRARLTALRDYRPPVWSAHMARIEDLIE